MAKKAVATLRTGVGKQFTKCIKMVKSEKTGAYIFKEAVLPNDQVAEFMKYATLCACIRVSRNTKGFPKRKAFCVFSA